MNPRLLLRRLKSILSKSGSLLLLFQRAPLVQMILPEAKILGVAGGSEAIIAIATVAGLGAYDSVAGATLVQQSPVANSTTVPLSKGAYRDAVFYDNDSHTPSGWRITSGSLPPGMTLNSVASRTAHVTGTPSTAGNYTAAFQVYDSSHSSGSYTFTFAVADATVTVSPSAASRLAGSTVTLTATSSGTAPFTYQWYQGATGVTTTPVGTNSATYTSGALATNTNYWVKCTDSATTPNVMNSATVPITVLTGVAKAGTGTDLAAGASWTGGAVPTGATAAGVWNSTSLGAGLTLASAASWGGVSVAGALSDVAVTGAGVLTLAGGGFDLSASTVNMTWGTPVAMSANQTWNVNGSKTLTLAGTVSSASGYSLTKDGAGTAALTGVNTYTGGTIVKAGTLQIGGTGSLGSGTYAGIINNSGILQHSSSANQTLSGVISNTGSIVKDTAAASTLTLTGLNTYSGTTTVSAGTLTVGGAGTLTSGATAGTYGSAVSIGSGATLRFTSSAAQVLSGAISGAGTLARSTGTTNLTVSGSNTSFNGNFNIQTARLVVTQDANLGSATLTLDGGGIRHENTGTTSALTIGTTTIGAGGGTIDISSAFTDTITTLAGSGVLTKSGSTGVLNLSGAGTFTGNITLSTGTLALTSAGSIGTAGVFGGTIANAATLKHSSTANQTFGGVISGAGVLTKDTSATSILTLSGANTYTGATNITAGTVKLGNAAGLGSNTAITTVSSGAVLDLNGQTGVSESVTLNGTGISSAGALINSSATAATQTGAVTLASNSSFGGTGPLTVSGSIGGTFAITKVGAGTLTLTGSHSYSGTTGVTAGSLVVNGTLANSSSAVTVNAGASLAGTGPIQRPVTMNGTLAPGNSVGTMSVTGATAVNGTYAVEVNGATADKLAVTGNLTLGAASVLNVSLLAGGFTQSSYVIAECTGGTLSGTFASVPLGYRVTYTSTQAILSIDPIVTVAVAPATTAEDGAGNLTYTFSRTGPTTAALSANFTVSGTASAGTDFTQTGSATFAIGASTAAVTIDPTTDTTMEPDETVVLTVIAGAGYSIGGAAAATGTITNDDTNPYDSWASGLPEGSRGMAQTPQNDGVTNLVKFAFNMNPLAPDVRRLTVGADGTAGQPGITRLNNRLRIEYLRRKASTNPGITYTPQCGSNLTGWAMILTSETVTSIDATWERVVVDGPLGETQCFGRVKVATVP